MHSGASLQYVPYPRRFFYTLDGIRGIAALLIVLRHIPPYFHYMPFQESYLAVDVFFLLSGVVMAQAYEQRLLMGLSVAEFLWIRIVRIYPLYILGCGLAVLAVMLSPTAAHREYTLVYSVLALMLLPNPGIGRPNLFPLNAPAWSLFFELAANALYARLLKSLSTRVLLFIILLSALSMMICICLVPSHSLDIGWTTYNFSAGFFRVGYSFFMGIFLYRLFDRRFSVELQARWHTPFMPWLLITIISAMLMASPQAAAQPYYDFCTVVFLFPFLIYMALWFQPVGVSAHICMFLGGISYAVYALHSPLSTLIENSLLRIGISVQTHAPWSGLGFLVFLAVLSWLLDAVYDKPVRFVLLQFWKSKRRKRYIHAKHTAWLGT